MPKKKSVEYITPALAGARLVSAALDLLGRRRGTTIYWELKVKLRYAKDYKPWPGAVALPMGGTITSGEEWDEDKEFAEAQERLTKGETEGEPDDA